MIKYKRVLLKLSGESLMGDQGFGIDEIRLTEYAQQIQEIKVYPRRSIRKIHRSCTICKSRRQ